MQSDVVCEHDFLHKAIEDEGEGQPEISLFHGERLPDLLEEMVGSDDTSSDQLWEEGSIGCEIHKGGIGRVFSTVHVNGIGHRLEGVERDAHGQQEFSPRYVRQKVSTELHKPVRVDEHVEVLERRKEAQIEGQGRDEMFVDIAAMRFAMNQSAHVLVASKMTCQPLASQKNT